MELDDTARVESHVNSVLEQPSDLVRTGVN